MKTARRRSPAIAGLPGEDGRHSPLDALWSTLDHASPFGLFQTDASGICTYANARWGELTGMTPAAALGRGWVDAIHPDDRERVLAPWTDASGSSTPQPLECRLLRPDGSALWVQVLAISMRDAAGLVVGYAGVVMDISERKAVEEAQRANEARLRALATATTSAIWTIGADGDLLDAPTARWPFLTDLPAEELASEWLAAVHPDDRAPGNAVWWDGVAEGRSFEFEQRVRQRDGSYRHFAVRAVPVRGEDGGVREWVGADVDITARKRIEEQLRETEHRLGVLADNIDAELWITDPSMDRFLYVSQGFEKIFGYPRSELEANPTGWSACVHPDDRTRVKEAFAAAVATDGVDIEYRVIRPDGRLVRVRERCFPVRDDAGHIIYVAGIAEDITARKEAEERLRASERQLRLMADAMPQVVWIADRDGTVRYYNNRVAQFAGMTRSETGTWDWRPVIHPDDLPATLDAWQRAVREKSPYTHEHRIQVAGGGYRWHLSRATPILDAAGEIETWYGTATDVHDLKTAEVALRANEERLRLGIEVAGFALLEIDYDADVIHLTAEAARLYGLGEEAITVPRERVHATFHPDDRDELLRRIAIPPASDTADAYTAEYRIRKPNGEVRWLNVRKRVVFDHSGAAPRPARAILAALDVTERKRVEDALRESEGRLGALLEQLPVGVGLTDTDGRWVVTNSLMRQFVGDVIPSRDPHIGPRWRSWDDDGQPVAPSQWPGARALRGETVAGMDFLFTPDQGSETWTRVSAAPFRNAAGSISGAIAVIQDVDARRRAEEALRHQSEISRTIAENATLALFLMDERQHCTFMNPAAERMTGFTLAEVQGAPLHDFVHHTRPDGSPYPLAECPIDRALPERARMQGEEVFVHKDGRFYPVAFTASPILRDGWAVGTVIEVEDISERKRHEANRQTLLDALAHDLRNPLTTIKMQTELLQRRIEQRGVPTGGELVGRLAGLEGLADRMTVLLDELDDLAHLTPGAGSLLDRRPIDLVSLIRERLEASPIVGGLSSLEFATAETELIGEWDEGQIRRVIENLLSNAVKYSPAGSAVRVRLFRDGANAVLQVEDQGIGIPAADQPHIFTFRHRGGNVGATPGSGAGLASVKQIVEHHDGTIAFASEEGVGSTFTVRLPLGKRTVGSGSDVPSG